MFDDVIFSVYHTTVSNIVKHRGHVCLVPGGHVREHLVHGELQREALHLLLLLRQPRRDVQRGHGRRRRGRVLRGQVAGVRGQVAGGRGGDTRRLAPEATQTRQVPPEDVRGCHLGQSFCVGD